MKIFSIPGINGLGKTKGCEKTPKLIIETLKEIYTSEKGNFINSKLLDIENLELESLNVLENNEKIFSIAFENFKKRGKFLFLGGDHSISYLLVKSFFEVCKLRKRESCLIVFDAHPDCMKPIDKKIPTHEEWLRALVEAGFPAKNILLVGVRNSWKDEIVFLKENKILFMDVDKLLLDVEDACDTIMEFASGKELYVSLDIDVVDPVFAPGTGYCEPGGLTSRQLIYLFKRISKMKNLNAVDLVEINSEKDKNNLTIKLGAKILSELI